MEVAVKEDFARNESGPQLLEIPIDRIQPSSYNPRKQFNEFETQDLADSIRKMGVLEPIIVRPNGVMNYEIVAGERRWRASKLAGLMTVPAIVRELEDTSALQIAIIENFKRKDVNPIEQAEGFRDLRDRCGLRDDQIASDIGVSIAVVKNAIRVLDLPEDVLKWVRNGRLSMTHARGLLPWKQYPEVLDMFLQWSLNGMPTKLLEKPGYSEAMKLCSKGLAKELRFVRFDKAACHAGCSDCHQFGGISFCLNLGCFKDKEAAIPKPESAPAIKETPEGYVAPVAQESAEPSIYEHLPREVRIMLCSVEARAIGNIKRCSYPPLLEQAKDAEVNGWCRRAIISALDDRLAELAKIFAKKAPDPDTTDCPQPPAPPIRTSPVENAVAGAARNDVTATLEIIAEKLSRLDIRFESLAECYTLAVLLQKTPKSFRDYINNALIDCNMSPIDWSYAAWEGSLGTAYFARHLEDRNIDCSLIAYASALQLQDLVKQSPIIGTYELDFLVDRELPMPVEEVVERKQKLYAAENKLTQTPASVYEDPTDKGKSIFVHTGIGQDTYGSFRRRPSGGLQRIKSPDMPMVSSREEAQCNLDAWAQKKGLECINVAHKSVATMSMEIVDDEDEDTEAPETAADPAGSMPSISKTIRVGDWIVEKSVERADKELWGKFDKRLEEAARQINHINAQGDVTLRGGGLLFVGDLDTKWRYYMRPGMIRIGDYIAAIRERGVSTYKVINKTSNEVRLKSLGEGKENASPSHPQWSTIAREEHVFVKRQEVE